MTGRAEIQKRSTGNQESMRNIGQDRIRSLITPICSEEEMTEIVVRLGAQLTEITRIEEDILYSLRGVEALRQSILAKGFFGQLIAQDPNDEPASVLLERVREERKENGGSAKKNKKTAKKEAA